MCLVSKRTPLPDAHLPAARGAYTLVIPGLDTPSYMAKANRKFGHHIVPVLRPTFCPVTQSMTRVKTFVVKWNQLFVALSSRNTSVNVVCFFLLLFCIASGNSDEQAVLTSRTFQRGLKWRRLCEAASIDDIHVLVFTRHSHTAEKFLSFVGSILNHVVLVDRHVFWRVKETECERPRTRIFFLIFCHHHHHPCSPEKP